VSCGTRVSFTEEPHFRLRGCHPLWPAIPCRSASSALFYSAEEMPLFARIPRPQLSNASTLALSRFRLVPVRSPLLGESLLLSFRPGTKMFQFPGLAATWLCIHHGLAGSPCAGFPIRRSPDHNLLAVPRSFSQLSTSFIASDRLGIHRAPFVA
jgi:hypothetical protein